MKIKVNHAILATLVAFLFGSVSAHAIAERRFRDLVLPTQKMVEYQAINNPAAAGTTDILSASDGPSSAAAASVTTFVAQPDVPRNIVITPGGTTTDIENCTITVAGTNIKNQSMSETFVFTANQSSADTGSKAFKTISSVSWPANCESGAFAATWDIGYGEKLGLKSCLAKAGHVFFSTLAGAKEATAPTIAASATVVESNTADFNGTMNGSNDFEIFFMQNFCP